MLSNVSHSDYATFHSDDLKKKAAQELAFKVAHQKLEEDYPDLKPYATFALVRDFVCPMKEFLTNINLWLEIDDDDTRTEVINYAQAWYKWERDGLLGEGEVPYVAILLKSVWKPDEDDAVKDRHCWGLMECDFEPDQMKWPHCDDAFAKNEQWFIDWRNLIEALEEEKRAHQ